MNDSITACPRCEGPLDPGYAGYSSSGMLVCASCNAHEQISASAPEAKPTSVLFGASCSLLIAVVSFCVESRFIFFILPLIALGGGIGTLVQAVRDEDTRTQLGWKRIPSMIMSSMAILVGLISLVVSFLNR